MVNALNNIMHLILNRGIIVLIIDLDNRKEIQRKMKEFQF